jgi:hypothetical protein
MQNLHLQNHHDFIPMTSQVIIWDFRLRIADLWNRYALSIIMNRIPSISQFLNSLIPKLDTCPIFMQFHDVQWFTAICLN